MKQPPAPGWYLGLLVAALVMALALALVSVHIRLLNSGLGCADWPQCYGRIGGAAAMGAPAADGGAPQQLAPRLASRAHRVIASTLGLVILAIAAIALARRPRLCGWLAPTLLLAVMVALAVLGNWSAGLQRPGVVIANFAGGIALAALLWWMLITARPAAPRKRRTDAQRRRWVAAALGVTILQTLLGGFVSAYFAGLACGPSWSCDGRWLPSLPWAALSGLAGVLELDATGRVAIGDTLSGLHMAHRVLGVAAVALVARLAWLVWRDGRPVAGLLLAGLVVVAAALGVAAVHFDLAPNLVLAHYALAVALLFALLAMLPRPSAVSAASQC
jgi:cytochrome c oxidase assembly protein subunit 15